MVRISSGVHPCGFYDGPIGAAGVTLVDAASPDETTKRVDAQCELDVASMTRFGACCEIAPDMSGLCGANMIQQVCPQNEFVERPFRRCVHTVEHATLQADEVACVGRHITYDMDAIDLGISRQLQLN